ncbi:MAG: hypothetical protein FGM61_04110 [Sediminibacterium sp.]|nr:hypothetical protein [Sediminibacterium sp.]
MFFGLRKLIAIGCLMLLCIQAGGLGWMKMYTHYQIKKSIRQTIDSGVQLNLGETFVFSVSETGITDPEFSWEEVGSEFLYKGNWYDVISMRHEQKNCIIQAVKDGEDTQLAAAWNSLHHNPNSTSPIHNGTLAKFFAAFDPQVSAVETIAPALFASSHFLQYRFQIPLVPNSPIDEPPCLL